MQRVALWWLWDSLVVWGIECAAGGFVLDVGHFGVFGEVSVQRLALWWVWDSLVVWGIECAVGGFVWVWDILGCLGK